MLTTRFTELVGCSVPIQSAPMGGVATAPSLPAAVSNAGGHGMVAAITLPAEALFAVVDEVEKRTQQPFGVNFLIPFLEDRAVVELAASRVGVIEFFYADPDPSLVELVHRGGALACWQVGSVGEARAAVDAGCDLVVAQGVEAGGHVRGRLGLLPLLSEVLEAVDVPVVAAGASPPPVLWPRSSPPELMPRASGRGSSPRRRRRRTPPIRRGWTRCCGPAARTPS